MHLQSIFKELEFLWKIFSFKIATGSTSMIVTGSTLS